MSERKGVIDRFIREPVEKVTKFTWKLSAFGALVSVALGKAHIGLQLAMITVAAAILEQQVKKSPK